ncbi:hypothetical protein [Chromobacterium sp. CV08]|uniref:hypothetical protein n=1 Tax=Chromobacterium sp. CV08 TaxID=3133274 RepID=UPI003DA89778
MQSKSAILAAAAVLAALASVPATAQPGQASPAQLTVEAPAAALAARQGLADFVRQNLAEHGAGLPQGFVFDVAKAGDLAAVRIGQGVPVYSVTPQQLLAADADLSRQMAPTGVWRFVAYLQQRPVGLVTVEKLDGRWQATSFGAIGLARNLAALQTAYGDKTRFLRVYQAQSDFLEVAPAGGGKPRFAALTSAYESLQLKRQADGGEALLDGAALIEPLRAAVRSNLARFR